QQQVNDGCFPSLKEVPVKALTLTIPTLLKADFLFCIVPGALKRDAVMKAVHGPISTSCPASILQIHNHCELFLDKDSYPLGSSTLSTFKIKAVNCLTGTAQEIEGQQKIAKISEIPPTDELPFIGPGLVDLQVNGINGVDFNDAALTIEGMVAATQYLLSQGVTSYLPTLITNSDEKILKILTIIATACSTEPLVAACVAGIHLEGPFLSVVDGARGAHDQKYIKAPSWDFIQKCQEASGQRIRLITLAPEWENAPEFIQKCRREGILISIGHTNANPDQINAGVQAGATLSTHLGNAVPLMLPRHPNLLWEQLAKD